MPVGTNATVKALDPDDLHEVGASHHPRQHLPPRASARARAHQRASAASTGSWPGTARSSPTRAASRSSAWAPAPHRRGRRDVPLPPRRLAAALHAGARHRGPGGARLDIAVCLDQPVPPHASTRAEVAEATARTARWAERCLRRTRASRPGALRHHPGRPGGRPAGATSTRPSPATAVRRPVHRRAGRVTRRPQQRREALDVVVPLLADDPRPRYLMGLGSPMDLLDAVDAGVDMFDSVLPARVARNGTLWIPEGRLNLRNARFLDDPRPVQEGCRCRALPLVLTGLSGPPVPGRRAARLPARDLSQPDLHPRLHGRHPVRDRRRDLPRLSAMAGASCRPKLAADGDTQADTGDEGRRMKAQRTVKSRRPHWAAPCGGAQDHGRQSPRPPRSQEEAEGRRSQAEARVAARFAPAQSVELIKPKRKPRHGEGRDAE